eukprot:6211840-Pleurochrysis_carterae.AAC.4
MAITTYAKDLPLLMSLRCDNEDQQSGHVAREERRAVAVREPGLPPQELAACEGCGANKGRRVRVTTQVMVQAMHPGGQPYPDPPHLFEQSTKLAQRRCVRVVGKRALDPLHGPDGLVAR